MRIAALYDIHGNLPALEAVLDEVATADVDRLIFGGDVYPGPMSSECLNLLLEFDLPVAFIRGNGDRAVLDLVEGREPADMPKRFQHVIKWVAKQVTPAHREVMRTWPADTRVVVDGLGEVLFCHATPRSDTEIFTRDTPSERLRPIFDGAKASLVICGHTHMPFDRMIGSTRVINAGSVGMPFGPRGADWLILGPDIEFRHTTYDYEHAAERLRATDYPEADDFADNNVLSPPDADSMRSRYTAIGL